MKLDTDKIKKIARQTQFLNGQNGLNIQVWVNKETGVVEYEEFIDLNSYVDLKAPNVNIGQFTTPITAKRLQQIIVNILKDSVKNEKA